MGLSVGETDNSEQEKAVAQWPQMRMFSVGSASADIPQTDCKGSWQVCTPATVGKFSATAYFFGRELHQKLSVPIGLIHSSVGGSPIESWISKEAQKIH
ncbi:hypothetical protein B4Q13_23000 [Lacticaseibacillus rhamnosus]